MGGHDQRGVGTSRPNRWGSAQAATWMALSAAPLRRLSDERKRAKPRGRPGTARSRPTSTGSRPAMSSGMGWRCCRWRGGTRPPAPRRAPRSVLRRVVALRADVERDRVAGVDGHADRRGGHVQVRQPQDLAQLGGDLALLAGPAFVVEHVDLRHHAVGDAAVERRTVRSLDAAGRPRSASKGLEPGAAGAADRLVRGQVDGCQPGQVADRRQRHDGGGRRAVRVGDQVARRRESAAPFASGTTSGTSGSRRKALELSTMSGTAAAGSFGDLPRGGGISRARNRTSSSARRVLVELPDRHRAVAEGDRPRFGAVGAQRAAGRPASARMERKTLPTTPRAPATPTTRPVAHRPATGANRTGRSPARSRAKSA